MRIVWVGNQHDQPTGYGTIAKNVIQHVHHNSRHEMMEFAVSGIQRVRPYMWDGVKVFGQSSYGGKMGLGDWARIQKDEDPDLWMINFDAWATSDATGDSVIPRIGIPYAIYPPVDHDPLPPPWYAVLRNAIDIVPYCDFGARVMREGLGPTTPISEPIHHGIDTSVFRPMDVDRSAVFGQPVDANAFIVGIFKNNQGSRAKYELQLEACRLFLNTVQDERIRFFILASKVGNQSPNLEELVRRFNLTGRVFIIGEHQYKAGLTAEELAPYYNACDVILNCVAGEGYGLPIIEAFGCGVPVIGTAFTSMPELITGVEGEIEKKVLGNGECYEGSRGWLVPTSGKEYTALKRSERRVFLPQDGAAALIRAYEDGDKRREMGQNAHKWVQHLDWKLIGDQWIDYFNGLESRVKPKQYTWGPLPEEEQGAVGGNKTACVVFSWNRPDYLVKTLDSLVKNTKADECDWFFYQDGWKNDERWPYCNEKDEETIKGRVAQCLEIISQFGFKHKEIVTREDNACIGHQLQEAKARLFQVYDNVIFFDDDHIVSPDYIDVLLKLNDQYPDAIVGAQATEIRNIPAYATIDMVGVTSDTSPGDAIARGGRWRWLAYLLPKAIHLATVDEMDEYMEFIGPSYRNIPHHAVRIKYGCEVTGFDGVMDVICNRHEIERIATVVPRARYIGESGLFGTPGIYAKMGFPKHDVIEFDETSYDKFISPLDEPDRRIEVHGHQMTPDARGRLEGEDPWLVDLMTRRIHPGDTVVDVGANIGYYTTLMSDLVGPTGKVIAFEPDPTNFALLEENTAGLENVVLVQAAVIAEGYKEGVPLYLSKTNTGDHRLNCPGKGREAIDVATVSLDSYFLCQPDIIGVDFIKIDVQGAEADVIKGAANLLAASPDVDLVVEYAPKMMAEYGVGPDVMLDDLESAGFILQDVRGGRPIVDRRPPECPHNDFTDLWYTRAEIGLQSHYHATGYGGWVQTLDDAIEYHNRNIQTEAGGTLAELVQQSRTDIQSGAEPAS